MTAIDATFETIPLRGERGSRRLTQHLMMTAAGVATLGVAGALVVRCLPAKAPAPVAAPLAQPAPAPKVPANEFGAMIVEPGWLPTGSSRDVTTLASLPSASPPADLSVAPIVGETTTAPRLPEVIPLPPVRDVPEIADSVPMPPARPPGLGAETPGAPSVASAPPAQSDNGNIFQRLFGSLTPPARPVTPPVVTPPVVASLAPPPPVAPPRAVAVPPPAAAPVVASAAPESRGSSGRGGPSPMVPFFEKIFGRSAAPAGYDQYTAVYDISAKVLYMPDGSRIEAHSGLGPMLDDPRYVHERARGATPPHLYELTMREALFHGVQAIRLNPVGGEGGIYGRAGLLAHPYMLGPNGDSNGCVSVKDYEAFLRAYQNGQIKRLAVVASL